MRFLKIMVVVFILGILSSCTTEDQIIEKTEIDDNGHLIITYTDGTEEDVGLVVGEDGEDGINGLDGIDGNDGINGLEGADGQDAAETYKISYVIDSQFILNSEFFKEDESIQAPNTEMYQSLHIEGWYTDETFTEEFVFGNFASEDLVLYARWYELSYTLHDSNSSQVARIVSYQGNVDRLSIPVEIDGYPVRELGEYSFAESNVVHIDIPNSVTIIEEYAFEKSHELESVHMMDSVVYIGRYAFRECTALEDVRMSDSIEVIGYGVFYETTSLATIELPLLLKNIESYAFYRSGLESIVLPDSVEYIGYSAFYETKLTTVTIPINVIYLYHGSFGNIDELTSFNIDSIELYEFSNVLRESKNVENVTISDSNPYLIDVDGVVYNDNQTSLYYYPSSKLGDVFDIPDTVLNIYPSCFESNQYIKEVNIHDMSYINISIFDNMVGLEEINVIPGTINQYSSVDGVLFNYDKSILYRYPINKAGSVYTVPSTVTLIASNSFMFNANLLSVILPEGLENITAYAFYDADALLSVNIPSTVSSIGGFAFYDCDGITDITINGTMTWIETYAFAEMDALESITLSDTVTSIQSYAFQNSINLAQFTVGPNIEYIANNAFKGCAGLQNIFVDAANPTYYSEDGVLMGYDHQLHLYPEGKQDSRYEIPEGITTIKSHVFENSVYLEEIVIPISLTLADQTPFYNLPNLHSIVMTDMNVGFFTNSMYKLYADCPNLKIYVSPNLIYYYIEIVGDEYRYDLYPIEDAS